MKPLPRLAFYLVPGLTAGLLLAAASCRQPEPPAAPSPESPRAPAASTASAPPGPRLPASDARVNEFGIHEKVLLIERGVRGREAPDGPLAGPALRFFWPYFVHEVADRGGVTFYRVGDTPRRDGLRGWVSAEAAVP